MIMNLIECLQMKANKYFTVEEIVSKEVYELLGDEAIKLFDVEALEVLEDVREILGVPLTCNNWNIGGNRNYSGYRDLNCKIGAPKSAHKTGQAFDLISSKMSAHDMRECIKACEHMLRHNIRIEDGVDWLHIDVKNKTSNKIIMFNA